MRMPSRSHGGGLKFNLTPMIDVVFNLIIFFLAASHLARSETADEVELPEATTGNPEEPELSRRLIVTILPGGAMSVAGKPVTLPQFEQLLIVSRGEDESPKHEFEMRIRTDRHVPYRQIEPVLLACARADIRKVRFAVLTATGEGD